MSVVNIHNADCMHVLKNCAPLAYDLAIVDPDYGLNEKISSGGSWAAKYNKSDGFLQGAPTPEYFTELFRVSKNQIVWGGNYFDLPPTRGFVIWDKIARMETLADCEYAWTSFDRNAKVFKHARNSGEKRIHITQKPIKLYKWLLQKYAKEGDAIIDTHGGSMGIVIAAIEYGFDITIFEIDKLKYTRAKKRILNYTSQANMFLNPTINFYD